MAEVTGAQPSGSNVFYHGPLANCHQRCAVKAQLTHNVTHLPYILRHARYCVICAEEGGKRFGELQVVVTGLNVERCQTTCEKFVMNHT